MNARVPIVRALLFGAAAMYDSVQVRASALDESMYRKTGILTTAELLQLLNNPEWASQLPLPGYAEQYVLRDQYGIGFERQTKCLEEIALL